MNTEPKPRPLANASVLRLVLAALQTPNDKKKGNIEMNNPTLLDDVGCPDMRAGYDRRRLIPTSTNGDIYLIRSHIAYHCGRRAAAEAKITPSRGHTYRVKELYGDDCIVGITDHYDHREGVSGIV